MTTTSGAPGYKLTVPLDAERFINLPDDPFEELLRPTIQQLTADETAVEIFFTADQIVLMAKAIVAGGRCRKGATVSARNIQC